MREKAIKWSMRKSERIEFRDEEAPEWSFDSERMR